MITLEQSKVGRADKIEQMVIDIYLKESEVLQLMPFANDVAPNGGSTLTYGYVQEKLPSQATFRALGTEYVASEAQVEDKAVKLAIFGGAFEIDRVIKSIEGQLNNMAYQLEQKVKASIGVFHNAMINGDVSKEANGFDGLNKMLVGTENEINTSAAIDLSNDAKIKENASAFYEMLTKLINDANANAIFVNADMKSKIQTVARVLGYQTQSEEAFGRKVVNIDGVRIIDLGNVYNVNEGVVTKEAIVKKGLTRTLEGGEVNGLTDIYAVKFDVNDGFHGVTITGNDVVQQYLPDFNAPGALKKGEVEMVACVALKNANNAGVLRNIKIA
jgi:hypothetical protein